MSWETGFRAEETGWGFILESGNLDGLGGKWELSTYCDELGVPHVRLSLAAAPDDEAWELIGPEEDGVALETLFPPE